MYEWRIHNRANYVKQFWIFSKHLMQEIPAGAPVKDGTIGIDTALAIGHYAPAMGLLFKKWMKDIEALLASPAGFIFLIAQCLLLGWSFGSSAGSCSNLSGLMAAGDLPAAYLSPLSDLTVPVFRSAYLYPALLLPAVVSGLLRGGSPGASLNFIGQPSAIIRGLGAKFGAAVVYLTASLALSLPALQYWRMLGGSVYPSETALLYAGYFLNGVLTISVSFLFASLIRSRAVASFASTTLLALPHLLDFIKECNGADYTPLGAMTLEAVSSFERGIVSPGAFLYFIVPAIVAFAFTVSAQVRNRKMKMRVLAAALGFVAAVSISMMAPEARGFLASHVDISDRHSALAASSVVTQAEQAITLSELPSVYDVPAVDGGGAGGSPLSITEKDLRDIRVVYWVLIPLLIGLMAGAGAVRQIRMPRGAKRVTVMTATWLALVLACALAQDFYIKNRPWKVFPSVREVLPRWAWERGEPPGAGSTPEAAPMNIAGREMPRDPNFIYAGDGYQNLNRFFKRLADLQAGRRDTVRIVHYGDSLIWGDCFSRTMKRRFQAEFGDGGRGIVPPAATMATALQDHTNTTNPGGFDQHAVRHEFRYLGNFYPAPAENRYVGFTGEGAFLRSPLSEIHMESPAGSRKWRRVQLFLRPPADAAPGSSSYCVRLDHDAGTARQVLAPAGASPGAVTFLVPPTGTITARFEGSAGPLPSVDAVNLETESGVAYSTVVRMGIHMAWLNAVPEGHLAPLREIAPDLLIFQFGVNEAASLGGFPEFTAETLRAQVREWLAKVKRLFPDTDVLVVGPPERLRMLQGALVPMEETMTVRSIQREEAARAGMAFFDTYDLLGGPGQMLNMVTTGLAMDDYTHFTMRGGDTAAGGMYDSLMNAFRKTNGRPKLDLRAGERTAIMFNSASYAYFLAVTVIIVLLIGRRAGPRFVFLAGASYYFYTTWNVWPAACLAVTTVTDYSMALLIHRARKGGGRGSGYLAVSLAVNLGILFVLKYFDFFSDLAGRAAHAMGCQASVPILNILLPVGISFYTFQSLSYTIDVWRGAMKPTASLLKYAHYVSLFTQLLAGPIVKAREFLPAIKNGAGHFMVTHGHFSAALFLILGGLVKKAGADWLGGSIVDRVYASPGMFTPLETLAAVYAYGLQIYGDFSGYSDIAIGSAMLLGYNLTENFRRPYAAASVSEFWQRWHISLGNWLREYLYISLGGNRKRVLFNLGITMLLCGLWHGAALPFVLWGAYHGLVMIVERMFNLNRTTRGRPLVRGIRVFATLHVVLFGWIIFRSDSWETFTAVLRSLSRLEAGAPNVGALLAGVMALFYAVHYTPVAWKERLKAAWAGFPATVQGCAAACITILLYNAATADVKPFIYFQF